MNLDEALTTIEILKIENKKLQNRVDLLEDVMYTETMEDYLDYVHAVDFINKYD